MGIDYATGAWRGIAGPKGLPADVATKLTAALKKVYDSKEFKEFMSNRGFGTVWGDAAEFATFMDKGDAQMGVAMKAAGLVEGLIVIGCIVQNPRSQSMRLPDRVTGLFLVGLGAAAAYGGWQLPPVPGQPVGPNVFPLVIGTGLALCGLAIAFGIGHSFEEEEELIPVDGGQPKPAAARHALRPARAAAAGAAAVLRGGRRPARLHHHGRADRVRDVDRARRAAGSCRCRSPCWRRSASI